MDYYAMFSDAEEFPPIIFSASSTEDAWDKLAKNYPQACVDNFEDIDFLVTEDDLDEELVIYHYTIGVDIDNGDTPKYTKESFKRVNI